VIVNLSSKPLNSSESSLLSKGLHFCPNPPKINVRELDEDLDQYARRLRIKEYRVRVFLTTMSSVESMGVLGLIPPLLNFASRFFENFVSSNF
jgi:hypothetical protein